MDLEQTEVLPDLLKGLVSFETGLCDSVWPGIYVDLAGLKLNSH